MFTLTGMKKSGPFKLTTHKVRKQNSLKRGVGMFAWAPVIARNNNIYRNAEVTD
jgi:hypothetical protein